MRWGRSDDAVPMAAEAKIATLLAAQTEGAPPGPSGGTVTSRSWTLTGTANLAASTTYRVSATVTTFPAADPAANPATGGRQDVENTEKAVVAADPALSYEQLARYRDALNADGYTVTEIFEGWRTIALDVAAAAPAEAPTSRGRKAAAEPVTAVAEPVAADSADETVAGADATDGPAAPDGSTPATSTGTGVTEVLPSAPTAGTAPDADAAETVVAETVAATAVSADAVSADVAEVAAAVKPAGVAAAADPALAVAGAEPAEATEKAEATDSAAQATEGASDDATVVAAAVRKGRKRRGDAEAARPGARRGLLRRRPAEVAAAVPAVAAVSATSGGSGASATPIPAAETGGAAAAAGEGADGQAGDNTVS